MTDYRFDAQKARTAALACWGTPANTINQPDPPADGEVAELVVALRHCSDGASACGDEGAAWITARAADLLEHLAEPELQGELIPDRYSGYQKTVYRDGFHAGYKHGLTCARAALAEPEPPRRNFVGGYQPRPSIGTHNPPPKNP
jgi:hypothetical protein